MRKSMLAALFLSVATLALVAAGCGGGDSSSGVITADGSSTVAPFTT
jgi:ABC-type phosphate transport system substrate-binding protein